jgi:hypothetical protein
MSARAPAGQTKRKKGSEAAAEIRESNKGEEFSLYIAQTAAHS